MVFVSALSTMANNMLANAGITLDEGRNSKKKMNGWQVFVSEKLEELNMDFGEASTHLKQQWRGMRVPSDAQRTSRLGEKVCKLVCKSMIDLTHVRKSYHHWNKQTCGSLTAFGAEKNFLGFDKNNEGALCMPSTLKDSNAFITTSGFGGSSKLTRHMVVHVFYFIRNQARSQMNTPQLSDVLTSLFTLMA